MMKKILLLTSERIELKSGGGMANKAFFDSLILHFPGMVDVVQIAHSSEDQDHDNYYFVPELSKTKQMVALLKGRYHRVYNWMPGFLEKHGSEYSHCVMNASTYSDTIDMMIKYGIKTCVIHHNYEVKYQMDNRLPSTLYGLTPILVRRNERLALEKADLNLYLTEYDKKTILKEYNIKNDSEKHIVVGMYEPNNRTKFVNADDNISLKFDILAVCGSLCGLQTEQSVKELFNSYFNIIESVYDGSFKLILAGRDPGTYIKEECARHSNVVLKSNPIDMLSAIESAGIFLCPVNCGSGLKLRIMDGLRLGMPILTHEVSARGYEQFKMFPWFKTYDNKESFENGLKCIIALIASSENLRKEIKNEYCNYFSFKSGDERFINSIYKFL